jgi:hypothetical protein
VRASFSQVAHASWNLGSLGIRCWQRNGIQIIGTLPGAFRHKQLGYVDGLVMVQGLMEGSGA